MTTTRIALFAAGALLLAACGSALSDPGDVADSSTTLPEGNATTTTIVVDPTPDDPATPDPGDTTTTTTTTLEPPAGDPKQDTPPELGDTEVLVYLGDPDDPGCGAVVPVTRMVQSPQVLTGALEALLAGPSDAELAAGYGSWFSDEVGWKLAAVTIADGVAHIDFTEDSEPINNASTSCGSIAFLAQLDMTATQFPTVDRTVYSLGGDIEAFYHWLQRDVPTL